MEKLGSTTHLGKLIARAIDDVGGIWVIDAQFIGCNADDGSIFLVQLNVLAIPPARSNGTQDPETSELCEEGARDVAKRCGVGLVEGMEGQWDEGERHINWEGVDEFVEEVDDGGHDWRDGCGGGRAQRPESSLIRRWPVSLTEVAVLATLVFVHKPPR